MAETKILFIRHGETEDNVSGIIQGRRPGKLTEKGKQQADKMTSLLIRYKVDSIYTSNLTRAENTARIAGGGLPGVSITIDERLREQDFGLLEGTNHYKAFRALLRLGAAPEIKNAVAEFIKDIKNRHEGQTVAAFTHFGPMYAVMLDYSDMGNRTCIRMLKPGSAVILKLNEATGNQAGIVDSKEAT